MVGDGTGADKSYMGYAWVRGEMISDLRPAHNGLYEVGGMAAGCQGCTGDGGKVLSRPCCGLGGFDHNGRAGKEGRYEGAHEIMELLQE